MRKSSFVGLTTAVLACGGFALHAAAPPDIVLYAADVTTVQGNWRRAPSTGSPGGQMLASADAAWSTTNQPLASPADYVDAVFSAPASTPYHVWLRLRATSDSKWNDSVWVQFDSAVDASSAAAYRIGTTNGLTVNLENCSGCGVAGWGWQDKGYWVAQPPTVQFTTTGSHRLRIQTREDGVQVDQIVLSPATYLYAAPGQVTNDATIVPKPAATPAPATSTPYSGSPAAIPGTIQAANFDNGGEGVAYHDTTAGNSGGAYRQTDVDLEPSSTGGNDLGWIAAGEWLKYSVNVATAGTYTMTALVASSAQGGTFHVEMNGANVSGEITIPNTGGWQNWQSVMKAITLGAGTQVARLVMDSAGSSGAVGNIVSLQFTATTTPAPGPTPYGGAARAIPGTVGAANFDNGGEGVAYHDTTAGNSGGAYRSTDVDLESSSEGGYDVGWTAAGEWLNYTVNAASSGSYTAQLRVASPGGGAMHVGFNGPSRVWASVVIPATGAWQAWTTVSVPVTLGAGQQLLTLQFDTAGINIASIAIVAASAPPPPPTSSAATVTVPAGGNLQLAIDAAQPGDTILLLPGVTYAGSFLLPLKSGTGYVTIRSAAADSLLPSDGVRIGPQHALQLPKVQGGAAGMPAFMTARGAHHYRLQFLEIVNTYPHNDIIELGDGSPNQNALSQVPYDLIVDRCYIHGDPTNGQKRGIALNSASTTIVNSYISDIKSSQGDSQAIMGWNGPGPYTIENNYLEAAGENFMLGGADPAIANLVPSDVSFRFNDVTKQTSWRGQAWVVKNLVEFKNAQRVVVDNNIIEYSWAAAQLGYGIVLTPRNQDGTAPWTVVQHIQITNNIVRHVASAINILGVDVATTKVTNDVVVRNNLFLDISRASWGGTGQLVLTQGGQNIVFDHNTVFTDGTSVIYADGPAVSGFVFTNNIIPDNSWAVMGSGAAAGSDTLAKYFPGASFQRNVIVGANAAAYPGNNFYPPTISAVMFTDLAGGNYALSSTSPYSSAATDGADVGCLVDRLRRP